MSLTPLALMKEGSRGIVASIAGGRGAHRNLEDLGIVAGKEIRVIRNSGGAVLVAVNGTRLVVGRGLAMKVMVDAEQKN
ncbi:FeoA family protein [Archaeoglobus veneficus]|uniref:FeoA family protein n=1 Tax=Archaeoglobus veneficus (strain DSM 11195 / SNP6) TaxID=693661 RepID=F2KN70_ARCVS|nr:FeoA domain-containing protein [Archaeoglobus veneficus]AEA46171.1 FeoA family protein [Archaeoglobus veneficus SNP6]